jgi:hypothetical protein
MSKALVHLVGRHKAKAALSERLRGEVARLRAEKEGGVEAVNFLTALDNDPLGKRNNYAATIEIRGESVDAVSAPLEGFSERIGSLVHADLSTALVGDDHAFIECEPALVRYQYLMRRNAEFDHEAYTKRYREIHSQFGVKTPGILSYVQFYVDPVASRSLAQAAGLGVWGVDSVSELHLTSIEDFIDAVVKDDSGAGAQTDEENFVDRRTSVYFTSTVDWDPDAA